MGLVFVWHRSFCNLVKSKEMDDTEDGGCGRKKKRRKRKSDTITISLNGEVDASSVGNAAHLNDSVTASNSEHHQGLIAIKSLSKVWSSYPIWDESNTLLLDDSPDKCPRRYKSNAIHPPPLCGTETTFCQEGNDDARSSSSSVEENKDAAATKIETTYNGQYSPSSFVNDDEPNQTLQHRFFERLATYWSSAPQTRIADRSVDGTVMSNSGKSLCEFLKEHADSHNMMWSDG